MIEVMHDVEFKYHDSNIINIRGNIPITKYKLGCILEKIYKTGKSIIPSTTTTFNSIPSSELMETSCSYYPKCIRDKIDCSIKYNESISETLEADLVESITKIISVEKYNKLINDKVVI